MPVDGVLLPGFRQTKSAWPPNRYAEGMRHPTISLLLPFLISCSVMACSSKTPYSNPKKVVTVETKEPILVEDVNGRVGVRVEDRSTIVEIDDRRFICRGYQGYNGRVNSVKGWIRVGRLDISFDAEKIWIRGPKSWTTFPRSGKQSFFAKQDGSVGRSVFKD